MAMWLCAYVVMCLYHYTEIVHIGPVLYFYLGELLSLWSGGVLPQLEKEIRQFV